MLRIKRIISGILAAGMALSSAACGQASATGFDQTQKAGQTVESVQAAEDETEKTYVCFRETYTRNPGDSTTYSIVTEYGRDDEGKVTTETFIDELGQILSVDTTAYFGDTELVRKADQKRFDETGALISERLTTFGMNEYGEIGSFEIAENGQVVGSMERTYDENGRCVLQIMRDSENGREEVRKEEYGYDENGNRISLREWHGDANSEYLFDGETTYEYDEQNRLRTEVSADFKDDLPIDCWVTKYNENGDIESVVRTCKNSALDYTEQYVYDEAGRRIEELYNGLPVYSVEYDGDGRMLVEYHYGKDGVSVDLRTEHIYGEDGKALVEYTYDEDGVTVSGRTDYEYDESGNLLCRRSYDIDESGAETIWDQTEYEYRVL